MWTRWSSSVSGSVSVLTWASCELTVSRILSSPWTHILGKGDTSCVDLPLQSLPAAARETCCISYFSASSGRTPGKDRLYACACAAVCPHPRVSGPHVSSCQRIPSTDGVCPCAMGPCTQTRGGDPWVGGSRGHGSEVLEEAASVAVQSRCYHREVHGPPSTWVTIWGQLSFWRVFLMVRW